VATPKLAGTLGRSAALPAVPDRLPRVGPAHGI